MQEKQEKRMVGKFVALPKDVIAMLKTTKDVCYRVYISLIDDWYIGENWDIPGEWVVGTLFATKAAIIGKSGTTKGTFYRVAWPGLKQVKLVEEQDDGTIRLPKLRRKMDISISIAELKDIKEMESRLAAVEAFMKKVEGDHPQSEADQPQSEADQPQSEGNLPQSSEADHPQSEADQPQSEADQPQSEGGPSIDQDQKRTLTLRVITDLFYKGIGQKKISKQKRESAKTILKKLKAEGFSSEDIVFAVNWTLKNAREAPYDISIVEHTIGQAIAAREKEAIARRAIEELEMRAAEEKAFQERIDQVREKIEAYKETLGQEERKALRDRAAAELRSSGEYKEELITDLLIELKENEILRKTFAQEEEGVLETHT